MAIVNSGFIGMEPEIWLLKATEEFFKPEKIVF